LRERWDEAADLVAAARRAAAVGEQLALPLHADRLEGRAACARGDVTAGMVLLGRSADGFAALGARWEEAWSRLLLAGVVERADGELAAAPSVFRNLGSVQEAARAETLLAVYPGGLPGATGVRST
jgi:hypothetical protein